MALHRQESMHIRGDDARAHPYRDRSRHLPMSPKVPMTQEVLAMVEHMMVTGPGSAPGVRGHLAEGLLPSGPDDR
jgi:hypothetical protein